MTLRVKTLAELDALIGLHVTREAPEIYWEDTHGHFQFHSEIEARQALADPYYQRFLPAVDWSQTVVQEVRIYPRYASDPAANWRLAETVIAQHGPMLVWREAGRWHVAFGTYAKAEARSPTIAVCLAALSAAGCRPEVDHDALDSELREKEITEADGEKENDESTLT